VAARALVVTNELGSGVVPANEEGRLFRKIAGEVNRVFALKSAEAWLVVSGIGVRLK
jgi:adenosylcobinamide kinase/adenosylcobinamide-phosphate guanylyltransferase